MKKVFLITAVILICFSCDIQHVFEEFRTLPRQTWNSKDRIHFNVAIKDTLSSHNVLIAVRNTGEYKYSNLYLFVTARSPNGSIMRDTVEITLADERGKWLGKGSSAVYTTYHTYRNNIRFPLKGIYQFDIEQAMWINELEHISHIGLRIEKATAKE